MNHPHACHLGQSQGQLPEDRRTLQVPRQGWAEGTARAVAGAGVPGRAGVWLTQDRIHSGH